jgi:hypothetical protein
MRQTLSVLAILVIPGLVAAEEPPDRTTQARRAADPVPRPEPVDPPAPEELSAAISRGVDFLLACQSKLGSWGSPTRTKGLNIYAPVPGAHHAFRAAVTSLCIMALIECGDGRQEVRQSIQLAEDWLLEQLPRVRRATQVAVYNVWAHAYAIRALVQLQVYHKDDSTRLARLKLLTDQQIEMMDRYESVDGGWGYYDFTFHTQKPATKSTSFVSATGLIALLEAQAAGHKVPERTVSRAISAIQRQRKPDSSYLYSDSSKWYPMYRINRPGGSLGRSQACNLALRMAGDEAITDQVLVDWLDRLIARNLWLDIGRKRPVPHESYFAVAGYFFYYGHFYASGCVEQLPEDLRPRYQAHLARILLRLQEKDGSWWDFPFYDYHQQYGTAMAMITLSRCRIAN